MKSKILGLVMVSLGAMILTGCAHTRVEPATQLDGGDVVMSSFLDVPGSLFFLPRGGAAVTVGVFGVGDVSGHVATSIYSYHAGGSARVYLGEEAIVGAQVDLMHNLDGGGHRIITPRLMTAAKPGREYYGGVQANIISPQGFNSRWEEDRMLLGLIAGADHQIMPGLHFQGETIITPLFDGSFGIVDQFSVSVVVNPRAIRRSQRERGPASEIPPTHDPRPGPRDRPAVPEWDYDEYDVPVY